MLATYRRTVAGALLGGHGIDESGHRGGVHGPGNQLAVFAPGAVNAEVGAQGAFGIWADGAVSESEPLVERIHRRRVENQG